MERRSNPPITLTRIEFLSPRTGGKHYRRQRDGSLEKETVGWLSSGQVHVEEVANMAEFCTLLNEKLEPGHNALTYGLPVAKEIPARGLHLVTKNDRSEGAKGITRSDDDFGWGSGPGIFAADYDPRDGHIPLSREELWCQFVEVAPCLTEYEVVWGCSSSSFIHDSETGEMLIGLKGQRVYFGVEDASDIPRAGNTLLVRMWLAGHGYIFISSSGQQLVRATTDNCMYQPSRLDYAAGAVCGRGLEQRRPPFTLISQGLALVDTRTAFPDLTSAELAKFEELVALEKERTQDSAQAQRDVWADERVEESARRELGKNATYAQIRQTVKQLVREGVRDSLIRAQREDEKPVLGVHHVIHLSNSHAVTVGEILRHPERYHEVTTADPLEPDYGGGRKTAKLYPYTRRMVSHAHGLKRVYILGTDAECDAICKERSRNFSAGVKRFTRKARWPRKAEESRESRIARMMKVKLK
ncbi:hypothetical protein ACS0VU_15085 [Aliiroseovarius sp. KMU-71]|uniref:hypothetical protein n=1 Tax=Aliiroseovarius sp. KMU-71 TaxID=3453123 RepID=UPI003F44DF1D